MSFAPRGCMLYFSYFPNGGKSALLQFKAKPIVKQARKRALKALERPFLSTRRVAIKFLFKVP